MDRVLKEKYSLEAELEIARQQLVEAEHNFHSLKMQMTALTNRMDDLRRKIINYENQTEFFDVLLDPKGRELLLNTLNEMKAEQREFSLGSPPNSPVIELQSLGEITDSQRWYNEFDDEEFVL